MPCNKSINIETDISKSWVENRNGFVYIKNLVAVADLDLDYVRLTGVGKKNIALRGLIQIRVSEMDKLMKAWEEFKTEARLTTVWEVQHRTLVDGWVNTWSTFVEEQKASVTWLFLTREEAEEAMNDFLKEWNAECDTDMEYDPADYRVMPKDVRDCSQAALDAAGFQVFKVGDKVHVDSHQTFIGEIVEITKGFVMVKDEYGSTESVTIDEVWKV